VESGHDEPITIIGSRQGRKSQTRYTRAEDAPAGGGQRRGTDGQIRLAPLRIPL